MKYVALMVLLLLSISACRKQEVQAPMSYDFPRTEVLIDGELYACVQVGNQLWMAENLKTRLDGGRLDGCMTYREALVGDPSKADLKEGLLALLDTDVFGDDMMDLMTIDYVINGMIVPDFMEEGGSYYRRDWETYSEAFREDEFNSWALDYFDRIEVQYLLVEQALKRKMIEEAADKRYLADYGYLYTYAASQKVVPAGWRIPTDEDWKKLESNLGMSAADLDKQDSWRGDLGAWFKTPSQDGGFGAKMGGGYVFGLYLFGDNYVHKGSRAYWWSSTKALEADTASLYITRSVRFDTDQVLRGTSRADAAYHIRLVKDMP